MSKQRLALIGAAVGFVAIRFAFAATVTGQREAIAAAVLAGGVFWGILRLGSDQNDSASPRS